jgi:hypothetical protein
MPDEEREKLEVIEEVAFRGENMKGLSAEDRA